MSYSAPITAVNRRPYKQVARGDAQQRTRDALLDAASEAFFTDSWSRSSLESLSATAGVTKQTLLRHFGSKEGLLMQAILRTAVQIREERWSFPPGEVSGAVENLLDHYDLWGERSMRIGAWQRAPTTLSLISQAGRQVHYEWIEYAFAPWLGQLDGDAHAQLRAALIVLCDVQTWWILAHDLAFPRPQVEAILIDLIERALVSNP